MSSPPAGPGAYWFGAETPQPEIMEPADSARGWFTAFDAETGAIRWRYKAPHPMLAAVAIDKVKGLDRS